MQRPSPLVVARLTLLCVACGILFCALSSPAAFASAKPASSASLPDAPLPQTPAPVRAQQPPASPAQGQQTKRILGIVPNFRAVSANTKLPPQTNGEKFKTAAQDSFDYSAIIFAAGQAGVGQLQDSYPEFGQGAEGYGKYFWHTFLDQTNENMLVEGALPVLLHQDNRYYTLGSGGIPKRTVYSFSRIAITRNDDGREVPNYSEIVGAGGAAGIAALYYPSQYRTWTKVGQRWLTSVIIDGCVFSMKEFWPDVNNAVFHQKD